MFQQILVALDGSELAERVLPYVRELAEKFGSTVTLIHATTPPETIVASTAAASEPMAEAVVDPTPIVEAEQEETAAYLRTLERRLGWSAIPVRYEQTEGSATEVILQRAAELGAAPAAGSDKDRGAVSGQVLIAMTTHGRGGLGRLVFGSVADEVLRHAPCPVLVVRVHEEPNTSEKSAPPAEVPII